MRRLVTMFSCLLLAGILSIDAAAQDAPQRVEIPLVKHDRSPALRSMPQMAPQIDRELYQVPNKTRGGSRTTEGGDTPDPIVQAVQGQAPSALINVFDGQDNDDNGSTVGFLIMPPDTDGDVSADHYFQMINLVTTIYDKTGTPVLGPVPGNFFWQGFGTLCESTNSGDPIVLWDEQAGRWFVSQFAINDAFTQFQQCIAISETSDPTGAYYRYSYDFTQVGFNDYPKHGITPDSYLLMVNLFTPPFFFFGGVGLAAIDRDAMLVGDPAEIVFFNIGGAEFGHLPIDLDGPNTVDIPELFGTAMSTANRFDLWEIDVDWALADPGASATASRIAQLPISAFDEDICTASREACVPQPGVTQRLEALADRLMHRLQVVDFGTHRSMVTSHTVDVGQGRTGIRWYEFRETTGTWSLYQEGTYAPNDGLYRWVPSIAMNDAGDIALGYSASSSSAFPSIRYTGQTADQSGSGVMNVAEVLVHQGPGSQTGGARWGDYAAMKVDPVDDTFWFTTEYSPGGNFSWASKIANFDLTGGVAPDLSVTVTPNNPPIVVPAGGGSFTYDGSVTNNSDVAVNVDVWVTITGPGVSRTVGPRAVSVSAGGTVGATLTQNVPAGAPAGTYTQTLNVGTFPIADASDSFMWDKDSGAAIASRGVQDWASNLDAAFGADEAEVPASYALGQNFPNPFNPTTLIGYEMPEAGEVTVRVFNTLGQEVAVLVDGYREAGRHEVRFDARDLSAGVYLYVLEAGTHQSMKQMVLLK